MPVSIDAKDAETTPTEFLAKSTPPNKRQMRNKARFYTLDALRGLAAMSVVAFHCTLIFHTPHCIFHGDTAVDFFFALSGFVIAYAHEERLKTKSLNFKKFFVLRVIRLWPMVVLGTAIGVLCVLSSTHKMHNAGEVSIAEAAIFSILTLPLVWSQYGVYALNGVFWSLLDEIMVNTSHACIFYLFKVRYLVVTVALSATILLWFGVSNGNLNYFLFQFPVLYIPTVLRALVPYLAGVVVFRIWKSGIRAKPIDPIWLVLSLGVLLIVPQGHAWIKVPLGFADLMVFFPMLVWVGVQARHRFTPLCEALGDLSYPLYAIHLPVLAILVPLIGKVGLKEQIAFTIIIPVVLSPLAWLVYLFIDTPIRTWLSAQFVQRKGVG